MPTSIAFVGAPGVGKSTLTLLTKQRLERTGLRVGYAHEYARGFIDAHGFPEHSGAQYHIMKEQKKLEASAGHDADFLLTDTAVFFSFLYPYIFRRSEASSQELLVLDDILSECLAHVPSYDVTFYLPLREVIEDDGIRVPKDSPMIDNEMRHFVRKHQQHFPRLVFLDPGDAIDQIHMVNDVLDCA